MRTRPVHILDLRVITGRGGGPEKTILLSVGATRQDRYRIVVAYMRNAHDPDYDMPPRAAALGVPFYDLVEPSPWSPRLLAAVVHLVRAERIDILHCHDYKSDLMGPLVRAWTGCRLVTTVHGWIERTARERLYVALDKRVLRFHERVIAVSRRLYDELHALGLRPPRLRLVHNAIDITAFAPERADGRLRRTLGLGPADRLVGAVGRLSPEKDLLTLLRAVALAEHTVGPIHVLLVGEGPQRAELEAEARRLGLGERVHLTGHLSPIQQVYGSLDVLALTSLTEGLPNVVLEAQAMHVPVVATDVGGVRELVEDERTGLLARPGDVAGIAQRLVRLLTDRTLADRLRVQARHHVCEHFSFDRRMRRLEAIYDELMETRGRTGA